MSRLPTIDASQAIRVMAALAVVAALYLARDIMIPTALAVLLTFMLYPLVVRLERFRFPHVMAVSATVAVAGIITAVVAYVVVTQALDLATRIPDYQENLRQKVRDVRASGEGPISRFFSTFKGLKEELAATQPTTAQVVQTEVANEDTAVKVEVVQTDPQVVEMISSVASPLMQPMAYGGVTLVLLVFLLLQSDDLRERLIWIAGMRQMSVTTAALDEAARRIGRYLRMQLVVNMSYGALAATGLWVMGVPNALLWGVLGTLLRFIPYLGPWLAAAMPTLLAIAVFPNWSRPLVVIAWFIVIEFFTNMVMEPWLYGSSTGISTIGVVWAAVFWAWVWGPVGLILAVPITVSLVVLGKYLPQFALFHQLFGSEDAVPEVARLYQRLLIRDVDAAREMVEQHSEGRPFEQICDQLLMPALAELKRDQAAGLIGREQVQQTLRALEMVIPESTRQPEDPPCPRVICIPASGPIDEAAAELLARTARSHSVPAEALSSHALTSEVVRRVSECDPAAACIVQVSPGSKPHVRQLLKMLATRNLENMELIEFDAAASIEPAARSYAAANTEEKEVRRERTFAALMDRLSDLREAPKNPSVPADSAPAAAL